MVLENEVMEKTNEELFAEYKLTSDMQIKQELVLRYVHIIKTIAMQMRGVFSDFTQLDDIVNEGVIVLMSAVDKFDIDKNVKFETFISKRIRGMIIDIARRHDWVPRSVRKNAKDIDNVTNYLFSQLGRMPEDKEIADYLHISLDKFQDDVGKTELFNFLSLEVILEENGGSKKSGQLVNTNTETMPEEYLQRNEMSAAMKRGMENLRENEQKVISLYYKNELTMKEIATTLDISEPRVSQIHANAIRKLKIYLENIMKDGA